jgi:hypothetical protein
MQSQQGTVRTASAAFLASFLARFTALPPLSLFSSLKSLAAFASRYAASAASPVATATGRRSWGPGSAALPSLAPTRCCSSSVLDASQRANSALKRSATVAVSAKGGCGGVADWQRHEVYYAACQAIMYTLCYHMMNSRSTADCGGRDCGPAPAPGSLLHFVCSEVLPLLQSPLSPLTVCLPSVSHEFAKQLAALGLGDLTSFLPATAERGVVHRPFEMLFPFDPYLLPLSQPLLHLGSTYRAWRDGHVVQAATVATHFTATPTASDGSHDDSDSDDRDGNDGTAAAQPARRSSNSAAANPFASPFPASAGCLWQSSTVATSRVVSPMQPCAGSSPSHDSYVQGASLSSVFGRSPDDSNAMSFSDPTDGFQAGTSAQAAAFWGSAGRSPPGKWGGRQGDVALGSSPGGNQLMGCAAEVAGHFWPVQPQG